MPMLAPSRSRMTHAPVANSGTELTSRPALYSPESDSVAQDTAEDVSHGARFVNDGPMDNGLRLSVEECERARIARDPAYDGRFFVGVRTTRIYCRPVCPVRPAKAENVRFYPSAAAAEAAGFRPCLRCRPETAPFSPAWRGSRATVERAARLII